MNSESTPLPPPPQVDNPSLFRRGFRWLFSWRSVKFALKGTAILVTIVAVAFNFENWRGKRAWEAFKKELEAKGEKLDFKDHVPAPVPDDQNFTATPLFKPLFQYSYVASTNASLGSRAKSASRHIEWEDTNTLTRAQSFDMFKKDDKRAKSAEGDTGAASTPKKSKGPAFPPFGSASKGTLTDMEAMRDFYRGNSHYPQAEPTADAPTTVLAALQIAQPALDELRGVSARPHSFFPIHFEETTIALLPHLSLLKSLTQVLRLRVTALLQAGKQEEALADVQLAWRLAESIRREPLMISQLVRIAMLQITIDSIWEGLAQNQWRAPHLQELQRMATSLDLLPTYTEGIRGERAFGNEWFEKMRRGEFPGGLGENSESELFEIQGSLGIVPRGLLYQNQITINRLHQEGTLPAIDLKLRRFYPNVTDAVEKRLQGMRKTPYNVMAKMLFPALTKFSSKVARAQTTLDCLAIACALERYRLAKEEYPQELSGLAPEYISGIPNDVMDGKPLRYIKQGPSHYLLYGIAWDEKDDGGVPLAPKRQATQSEFAPGDWVWMSRP